MKLIQDWTDYNESLLFKFSDDYFKNSGSEVFNSQGKEKKHVVPNALTNSYAHAKSICEFVKANLENYPAGQKIKVLEAGAGSGIFARHFLLAARELGISDRVEYLISDYSRPSMLSIREIGILGEFEENKDYKLIELDVMDPSTCKDIDGNPYELNDISCVIMNYLLCVIPLTLLRRNPETMQIEEMQMRFHEPDGIEKDFDYLENLKKEGRWVPYNIEEQSDYEKKFYNYFLEEVDKYENDGTPHLYMYGPLQTIDSLLEVCNENGFVYVGEMPNVIGAKNPYKIYANSIAHPISDGLITSYCNGKNLFTYRSVDKFYIIMRLLIMKNPQLEKRFGDIYREQYFEKNDANLSMELRKLADTLVSKRSAHVMKVILDELQKIDGYAYEIYFLWAKYYRFLEDKEKARENFEKAKELDFLSNQNIDDVDFEEFYGKELVES